MKKQIFNAVFRLKYLKYKNNVQANTVFMFDSKGLYLNLKTELEKEFIVRYYTKFDLSDNKQIKDLKESSVVLLDNYYHPLSIIKVVDKLVIQLWHANGAIKKFGLAKHDISSVSLKEQKRQYQNYSYVIAPSSNAKQSYMHAFGMSANQILVLGSLIFSKYNDFQPKENDKKIVLYVPTFRENGDHDEQLAFVDKMRDNEDIIFLFNLHPLVGEGNVDDVYEALYNADEIISDYSSLIIDGLALGKQVTLHQYDFESYSKENGLFINVDVLSSNDESLTDHVHHDYTIELLDIIRNKGV